MPMDPMKRLKQLREEYRKLQVKSGGNVFARIKRSNRKLCLLAEMEKLCNEIEGTTPEDDRKLPV